VKIMERADRGVGEILAALDRAGLSQNTLLVFTNDNGGEWLSRNAPLFNRKFTLYEGGIRVPGDHSLARARAGRRVSRRRSAITMDLSATFLAAAACHAPADAKLEGMDLVPLIRAWQRSRSHARCSGACRGCRLESTRGPRWRLEAAPRGQRRVMLFDVSKDLGERDDMAASNTAVVRRMHQQLLAWEKDVDSEANGRVP
jgi:arylsulfatase A-like enzyme